MEAKTTRSVGPLGRNLKIVRRQLSRLVEDPANARKHNDRNMAAIESSLERFGQVEPLIVQKSTKQVVGGNGRLAAMRKLGWKSCSVVEVDVDDSEATTLAIALNRTAELAEWDTDVLADLLKGLDDLDLIATTGFNDDELNKLIAGPPAEPIEVTEDETPELPEKATAKRGQIWKLGPHRVMCGDSTDPIDMKDLLGKTVVDLVHADPPYGMGKEADGVLNDNLRNKKLDEFQMKWIYAALEHATDNAGLYIWGNAEGLWRLWFGGGLQEFDHLTIRNEIVWDKGDGRGMTSGEMHSYSPATERCLFMMRGEQFLGNANKDDYWEGYEPMRLWLVEQRKLAGFKAKDIKQITGTSMAGHWFGKSQFAVINRENYDKLCHAAEGGFSLSYDELMEKFAEVKKGAHARNRTAEMQGSRTFFDNTHDTMTDVWQFARVKGEERFGHATPKPVRVIARALRSSCPEDGVVLEPFLGTGTTLIAAEHLGRRCYGMELEPKYVDIIIARWEALSGKKAKLLK